MARIRTIKPEFFTSADVTGMTPLARLLFIGLWGVADREGRFKWRPADFKLQILPGDDCDIEELCEEITDRGLVVRYGDGLAHIPTFAEHQSVNPREQASRFPAPDSCVTRADASNPDERAQRGKEGKGKEEQPNGCSPAERGKAKRKTRLPEDWSATAELLDYARAQGCPDPSDTATRFKLHHLSKGTLAVDWDKAFQYWCRNEKNFRRPSAQAAGQAGLPVSRDDDVQWEARFRNYQPGGMWQEQLWGPRPESGLCLAPQPVLERWRGRVAQ